MELRGDSTVGGKRIATMDDILRLESKIFGSGGSNPDEGLPTYKLEIWSSAGDRFRNGKIDTWLEARVYRGARDVTELILGKTEYKFYWQRLSGNESADLIWENNRLSNHKQHITKDDVPADKCTFRCKLIDTTTNTIILQS